MTKVTKIPGSRLEDLYPFLESENIPESFEIEPITFKSDEIETYSVLFLHRLMKKHYGKPPQIEVEIDAGKNSKTPNKTIFLSRTETKGKWKVFFSSSEEYENVAESINKDLWRPPKEWRYFLTTKSGGIILVGTKDRHTAIIICHVLSQKNGNQRPPQEPIKDGKAFVSELLKEAKRLRGQMLSPKKEFENTKGIGLYLLDNVYLINYGSAELMLELSEKDELHIGTECIRYDASSVKLSDSEQIHIDKYRLGYGMYYQSCISFYFMALEGFVNLLYHSFLREDYRDLDWEKDLDLEKKIRFMSALCTGFKSKHIDPESEVLKKFKSLKSYRNQVFHSKIEDALKSVCIIEDAFYYNYDMKKLNLGSFPANKINLRKEHVLDAKRIVDGIVGLVLSKMDSDSNSLVRRFILKEVSLPFWKDESGRIQLGHLPKKVGEPDPKTEILNSHSSE